MPDQPYDLVVAAESLHWMEWNVVLPRIAAWLRSGAWLCLVLDRSLVNEPWMREIPALIARYSTNREFPAVRPARGADCARSVPRLQRLAC